MRPSLLSTPGWQYPVVADLASGELRYDNFGGRWGEQLCLDRFLQTYAVEVVRAQARRKGHTCTEEALADGNIKLERFHGWSSAI
jgi:hypothetical protein